MKLIACHIENFGRLRNEDFIFSEGINYICEENGWGKSTFAAFLRVMFYGFEGDSKKSATDNERKRFEPWQGGVFGGSITFENEGRTYVVTRTFGNKAANDTFELRDAVTNLENSNYSERLGEEIFGINSESFARTICISQSDCETRVTDGINARIGAIVDSSEDLDCYELTDKRLNDILNAMSPTRKTGALYRMADEKTALTTKLSEITSVEDGLDRLSERIREDKLEIEKTDSERERYTELQHKVSESKDRKTWRELYSRVMTDINAKESKMAGIMEELGGEVPEKFQVNELITLWNEKLSRESALRTKKASLASLKMHSEQGERLHTDRILFVIPIFLFFAGAMLYKSYEQIAYIFFAAGIIGCIGGFIITRNRKNDRSVLSEEYLALEKEIENDEHFIEVTEKEVRSFILSCNKEYEDVTVSGVLQLFLQDIIEYEKLNEELAKLKAQKAEYEKEYDPKTLSEDTDGQLPELSDISRELERLSGRRDELKRELDSYNYQYRDLCDRYDDLKELEGRLQELTEEIAKKTRQYRMIEIARKHITSAKEKLTQKYTGPIRERFDHYYEILTGKNADDYVMDANTEIHVNAEGRLRDRRLLSTGYRDIVGLCLRFALSDVMYSESKPFLIMDDPFVNLDDNNLSGAMELLKTVADDYQVLYFSCSEERKKLFSLHL